MRHRRGHRRQQHRSRPHRRAQPPRISRLRFGRSGRAQSAASRACAASAGWPNWPRMRRPPAWPPTAASPTPAGPRTAYPPSAMLTRTFPAVWRWCITASSKTSPRSSRSWSLRGYVFTSDTDTEVIAHLIQDTLKVTPDLFEAVRLTTHRLVGAYAIAVLREGDERIVVARNGAPLLLGLGEGGNYAASDAAALLQVTRTHGLSGRRRHRRTAPRRRAHCSPGWRRARAAQLRVEPVGRRRRARPVSPLHAEGNLRAAAGAGQHPGDDRRRRRPVAQPVRRRRAGVPSRTPRAC